MNATSGSGSVIGSGPHDGTGDIGGLGHGIIIFVGILLIIIAITFAAYFCTRGLQPVGRLANQSRPPLEEQFVVSELGLDEATIMSYPKMLYAEAAAMKSQHDSSTNSSCCSICLMDYKAEDELRLLPECGHLFHQKCVDPWLRLHMTCPVCRNSPMTTPLSTPLAEAVPLASHPA